MVRRSDCERHSAGDLTVERAAGPYISITYCLTMRRVENRGTFERIASRTIEIQRRGKPRPPLPRAYNSGTT